MSMNSADLPAATRTCGIKEGAKLSPEPTQAARPSIEVSSRLLDEYLDLKERVKPLEKRLERRRNRLLEPSTDDCRIVFEHRPLGAPLEAPLGAASAA